MASRAPPASALALGLLVVLALLAAPAAARTLKQSDQAPPAATAERGNADDVLEVANRLTGPNANKFSRPQPDDVVAKQQFLISFADDATEEEKQQAISDLQDGGAEIIYQGQDAWSGIAVKIPGTLMRQARLLQRAVDNRGVKVAETDMIVTGTTVQSPATWGIDRLDQRSRPLSNSYTYTRTGAGVNAYVIDSGMTWGHVEFSSTDPVTGATTSRAVLGLDTIGTDGTDCVGHGTHTAATLGGNTYGVAKGVKVVVVRVLDCSNSGTWAQAISGIDFATKNHTGNACVVNMSLSGGRTKAVNDAVTRSIASGCVYAVAAGNNNRNACRYSPASVPNALTVAATDSSDVRYAYSNWGGCVRLSAPGVRIMSAWMGSTTATRLNTGTSMASPHVAGAAALYLEGNPAATPLDVNAAIVNAATSGAVVNNGRTTVNKLLYVGTFA